MIEALKPTVVWNYFYELTQIPRITGHTLAVASYVERFGKNLGLETLRDEIGNILIRKPATKGMENCKPVILQSHLDMVPQKNASTVHDFFTDPIKPRIDGDWVTASGTTLGADNGIGVAMAMSVLSSKTIEHGPVEALFTIDEEVGMVGAFNIEETFLRGWILINLDSEEEGQLFAGCAGGQDISVSFDYNDIDVNPKDRLAFRIDLTGLKGGHSGVDIHLGRANANKLMFHFLHEAFFIHDAQLCAINGGSLRNAIPREATAIITIKKEKEKELRDLVEDFQQAFRTEYAGIETNISFSIKNVAHPPTIIPPTIVSRIILAIEGCQNGVISMLHDFPDTVESSSNMASIISRPGNTEVRFLIRSASERKKSWVYNSIESIFTLAEAAVDNENAYSGWQPNIQSPILNLMKRTYETLYGKTPAVKVIHAGLECGIIQGIYPDMDMVSIGPDLQYPHSPDERVNIASVEKTWNYLTETLKQIKNI
ncbi:MAG: aminoacyl-histidine dipeptidase [Tannerellaceae bacterium]|jgi:dipeptidase D|nr:aminoacyl-histidine dipeptidase [Tannerellaceae bacterium]